MKRYEVIAIVKSDLPDDDITSLIERIEKIITKRKGLIVKIDKWGKRRLAYEINKQKDGYYFFIDLVGDGPIIDEIERNYKIDDRILKFITIKKDGAVTSEGIDQEIAAAEAKRTQARIESDSAGSSSEGKVIQQIEKLSADTKDTKPRRPAPKKSVKKDEQSLKEE
ncbi:MAG: 30S ribosomal protein S6 [Deltaproteobacteria bacterium RBG_16_44_11]|nr:MAG: 30S ribosomal protein S6 [Deltaproteobacteria bacterium RBG_16_44_11]